MPANTLKFAPREVFEEILEYAVIPTFDLVIEMPSGGVLVAKRKIEPYASKWALPGLRMMKPESIEDTIVRIAKQEAGVRVNPKNRTYLGQYVGRFRTERNRQDLSTGFVVTADSDSVAINADHFSSYRLINDASEIPVNIGAMYRQYLRVYFDSRLA